MTSPVQNISSMTAPVHTGPVSAIAGGLFAAGMLMFIARALGLQIPLTLVGLSFWIAVSLLWTRLAPRTRVQISILLAIGIISLLIGRNQRGPDTQWSMLLTGNINVVAMLIGVSFLALIQPKIPSLRARSGKRGVFSSWLSVHLLGSIINISAVFLVGDRLLRNNRLEKVQLLTLNRGLTSAGLWSPFFASMGVALSFAPAAQYPYLLLMGLPLAVASLLLTISEMAKRFNIADVAGFSLQPANLWLPILMAALVMLFHYIIMPDLPILSIITLLAPGLTLCLIVHRGLPSLNQSLGRHISNRLPQMVNEVALFMAAGLMTFGISTLIDSLTNSQWQLFEQFGAVEACISYLAILISAVIGLHPVIGISVLTSMLNLPTVNHTLLAFVSICSWSIGTAIGPLSGINLSLQGRYNIDTSVLLRFNLIYAAAMSILIIAAFFLLASFLNI